MKILKRIYHWFKSLRATPNTVKSVKPRKKPDYHKFSAQQKERIKTLFDWHAKTAHSISPSQRKTQDDLRDYLNDEFGLNKSTSAYRRVWKQKECNNERLTNNSAPSTIGKYS